MKYKKKKYKKNQFDGFSEKNEDFDEKFKNSDNIKKKKKFKSNYNKKTSFIAKFFIITSLLIGFFLIVILYFLNNFKTDQNFDRTPEGLGLKKEEKINEEITNIAIFGLDKRKGETTGRSDSIIIVSLDGINKLIKITSILRDTRLLIDGYGYDKLGHAFSYGGANLAVKTLNKNFKLDIRDYVALNFGQMIHIVDAFGGVDTVVRKDQIDQINGVINSTPEYKNSPKLAKFKEPEKFVHLNGAQALSYARIRKKDDEHHRAARQQIILDLLIQKLGKMNVKEYPGLLERLLPFTETSLGFSDILKFTNFFLKIKSKISKSSSKTKPLIIKEIIPHDPDVDDTVEGKFIEGIWYWKYDINKYAKILQKFIYGSKKEEEDSLESEKR